QYTGAACCNEIIGLSAPASVANLSTSAGMEDYNSFGPRSAAKAARAVDLAVKVVAVELLCAAEALEYQRPLQSGEGVERAHRKVKLRATAATVDAQRRGGQQSGDRNGRDRERHAPPTTVRATAPLGRARAVRAPRGPERVCKTWAAEAAMRMLMNNLDPEVA